MGYYIIKFKDEKIEKYAIWYTGNEDGFVCENGKILFFDSIKVLKEFCNTKSIAISHEDESPATYDFGYLKKWLCSLEDDFSCSDMLDFWNIISDALKTMRINFIGDRKGDENINNIYDKIFDGWVLSEDNNIGEKHILEWEKDEIDVLQKVLSQYIFFWH